MEMIVVKNVDSDDCVLTKITKSVYFGYIGELTQSLFTQKYTFAWRKEYFFNANPEDNVHLSDCIFVGQDWADEEDAMREGKEYLLLQLEEILKLLKNA